MNNVTLNDFRSLLGKVNDGNIVFKPGEDGIEKLGKVNYGRVFTHEKTANSSEMNNRVRAALFLAIMNSVEGQSLQKKSLTAIATYLGVYGDRKDNFGKPLERRQLKAIFAFIDNRATFDAMIAAQNKVVSGKGLVVTLLKDGVTNMIKETREFATAAGVVSSLCGIGKNASFNGHSKAEIEKFVNGNLRSIQAHLYDKLFVMGYDMTEGGRFALNGMWQNNEVSTPAALVRQVVTEMMEAYGKHAEPGFELDKLRGLAEGKFFNVEVEQDVADGLGNDFKKADDVFKTLMPGNSSSDFKALKLARLNHYLLSTIKMSCNQAYLDGQNSLEAARNCLVALFQQCGLDKITADEIIQACTGEQAPTVVTRFQEAFLANVERLGDVDQIPPDRILKAAGDALKSVVAPADLESVVADHIAEKVLPGEAKETCCRLAQKVLSDPEVTPKLRSEVRIALLKGDKDALVALKDGITRAIEQRGQDENYVRDRLVDLQKITKGKEGDLAWLRLPENEDEFNGKVVALLMLEGAEALADKGVLARPDMKFIDSKVSRATVEEMMRKVSVEDVDFAYHYYAKGIYVQDNNISVMGGGLPFFDGLRDGVVSAREMTPDAAQVLSELRSHYQEYEQGGRDVEPVQIPHPKDAKFRAEFDALVASITDNDDEADAICTMGDLGTKDIGTMLKMLKNAGIAPKDLGTPEGFLRLQLLIRFTDANGTCEGVLEFAERLGGKSFAEMSLREMVVALCNSGNDPLAKLADQPGEGAKFQTVANYLKGSLSTREAKLPAADLGALLKGLRALSDAQPGAERTVNVRSVALRLVKTLTGDLKAVITAPVGPNGELRPVALRVPHDAGALVILIENEIAAQAKELDRATLEAILPAEGDPAAILSRTRELCTKIICVKLGVSGVSLSGVEVARLREMALLAASGKLKLEDLPKGEAPKGYNSQEAIELRRAYVRAPREETDAIHMPPVQEPRTRQQRETQPPPPGAVRDFLADLMMNKETWFFDGAQDAQPGERIRKLLVSWGPELKFMLKDVDGTLENVPAVARGQLHAILDKIGELGDPAQASAEKCDELETLVAKCADQVLADLQVSVKNLFDAKVGPDKEVWEKSLGELAGGNGLDLSTPNGRFVRKALESYFVKSGPIEKRAMLSAFLRNTNGESSDASQVAELLKGAGPILQKMLQGLPMESFGPETQSALLDMKSNLPPIPEEVVKAQLLELKRASGGAITSIEFIRTIGAATVGQAVLCRIKTKEHPVTGVEVVIKLLRPNVITAAQREYAFFMSVAQEQGEGMPEAFQAQYDGILDEMDFTHEAENVDLGVRAYNRPRSSNGEIHENVRSLDRHPAVLPLTGALVLTKVEGQTYDGFVRSARADIQRVSGVRPYGVPGGDVRELAPVDKIGEMNRRRADLIAIRNQAVARRKLVMQFADAWLNEALLGNGFLHGDLHAGNLMTDGTNVSVIDYGNAMRLAADQQKGILRMLTSSMSGGAKDLVNAIKQMLPPEAVQQLEQADAKGALTDELKKVLARGTMLDGVSRLAAALTCVLRAGVGMPPAVTCFIQSLTRLKAVVSGLDDLVRETESTIGTVTFQLPPDRPNLTKPIVVGELDLDATMEEFVQLLNGTGTSGPDSTAIKAKNESLQKVLNDEANTKKQILKTVKEGGLELVRSFCKRYASFEMYSERSRRVSKSSFYDDISRYLGLLEQGPEPDAANKLYESVASAMLSFYREVGNDINNSAQLVGGVEKLSPFEEMACETVTNNLGVTIQKMTGKTVDVSQNDIKVGVAVLAAFGSTGGTFGVMSLMDGVKKARASRKQFAERLETAKTRHGERSAELRVAPRIQLAFDAIASEVRIPQGGLPKSSDTAGLVSVLRTNLREARLAHKRVTGADTPLTQGELAYLADVLNAGTDNKLAAVLKSAKAADLVALLAKEGEDAKALQDLYQNLIA